MIFIKENAGKLIAAVGIAIGIVLVASQTKAEEGTADFPVCVPFEAASDRLRFRERQSLLSRMKVDEERTVSLFYNLESREFTLVETFPYDEPFKECVSQMVQYTKD